MISMRNIFNFCLSAFLFIGVVFYLPVSVGFQGDPIEYGYNVQELFFRFGCAILILLSFFMDPIRKSDMKIYGIFTLYAFLTAFINGFDIQARRQLINVIMGVLFIKTMVEHYDFKSIKTHIWVIFSVLAYNLIIALLQVVHKDPIFTRTDPIMVQQGIFEVSGLMKVKAHLGTLAAMCAPLLFLISPVCVLIVIPMIFFSKSSAAVVAVLISCGYLIYCLLSKKKNGLFWFGLLSGAVLALGALYIQKFDAPDGQFAERFKVWFMAVSNVLKMNPYIGLGIGKFAEAGFQTAQITQKSNMNWVWAHNEYVQAFYEMGFLGLIIISAWIKRFVSKFIQRNDFKAQCFVSSFISLCLVSFLHFPFHIGRLAVPAIFIISICEAYFNEVRNG